jgi:hypothetical protein
LLRQVRQVRDDKVNRFRERLEEISLDHVHAILDSMELRVLAGELDSSRAGVGRPDLDMGTVDRERDRHGTAPGPDVRDTHRDSVDPLQRLVDETLRRGARREHLSGRGQQRDVVEGRFHKLLQWWTGPGTHVVKNNATGTALSDCRTPAIRTPGNGSSRGWATRRRVSVWCD